MLQQVRTTIREHALFVKDEHLLLAVSGGPDSVALTLVLSHLAPQYRLRLTLAHLHHGIRGQSADKDAAFVQALAQRLGLPCVRGRTDVPALARKERISIEMAARTARHAFLRRIARRVDAQRVALGHTSDDQAETILLRLLRGAGPDGLAGIRYSSTVNGMLLVRPLLDVSRTRILRFLERRHASWREDESNRDTAILRNRVRHELLPLLEQRYNPQVRDTLRRSAEILAIENQCLSELAAHAYDQAHPHPAPGPTIRVLPLADWPRAIRRRALRAWLTANAVPAQAITHTTIRHLEDLIDRDRGGRCVQTAGGWRITHRYDELHLARAEPTDCPRAARRALNLPGETLLPELGLRIHTKFGPGLIKHAPTGIGTFPARATLTRGRRKRHKLFVRTRQPGDRFAPLGLRGTRKLQDILVDLKVPREQRDRVPVFECAGSIVWIPGYTIARDWKVTDPAADNLQIRVDRL